MLINNKGTKVCSRFRFSALFFNLEASLQPLIPAQDKSSCLLYIKANTIAVKKCEHTFLLWAFDEKYDILGAPIQFVDLYKGLSKKT